MKNILFVVDEKCMGGVSILLEDILSAIDNVDILILHNRGNRLENKNIIYGTKFFEVIDLSINEVIKSKNLKKIINKIYLVFLLKTGLISKKIRKERKRILSKNYDIEVSFKNGFTTLFTYYGDSKKKINWIHNDCKYDDPAIKYRTLFKKILPQFDYNVLPSNGMKENFNEIYKCSNTIVINNIVNKSKIDNYTKNVTYIRKNNIHFVTVGRLAKVKQIDKIIEAFNNIKEILNNTTLTIVGAGHEDTYLKGLVKKYHLENNIIFVGEQTNPYKYIKESDMLILNSSSEGFGLVIVEALLCQTPVLCTNISSAKELIDKKYGIIMQNNLEENLKNLINNRLIIDRLRNNLKDYNYDNEKIISQIKEILK